MFSWSAGSILWITAPVKFRNSTDTRVRTYVQFFSLPDCGLIIRFVSVRSVMVARTADKVHDAATDVTTKYRRGVQEADFPA